MKITKPKIVLGVVLVSLVLGIYIYHFEITKPYRVARAFLDLIDRERYAEALKIIDDEYARPIIGKDSRITGVHFECDWKCDCCNTNYHYKKDIYFAELKGLKIHYRKGVKGLIKRNLLGYDMYERGFIWIDRGYQLNIKGNTIKDIWQKI